MPGPGGLNRTSIIEQAPLFFKPFLRQVRYHSPMSSRPASKLDRRLLSITLLSGLTLILVCVGVGAASFTFLGQNYRYPNSTPNGFCPSTWPSIRYNANARMLQLSATRVACYSTPDPLFNVLGWYVQQGWPSQGNAGSLNSTQQHQAGPFNLTLLKQIEISSIHASTEIFVITGYQLNIGGPP
jgi:hypothetical protein